MGLKKFFNTAGFWVKGLIFKVDQEIQFNVTANPEIDTQGGGFTWKTITNVLTSWKMRDAVKGQDIIVVDTVNDRVSILPPYQALGFIGEKLSAVATTDATPTEIDKISDLTDNNTHLIEVKLTCKSDDDLKYGIWYVILTVTKFNGTVTIQTEDTISHSSAAGLNTNSVTYSVNGGDVDIDVTGIMATNIQWDCQYVITLKSTN